MKRTGFKPKITKSYSTLINKKGGTEGYAFNSTLKSGSGFNNFGTGFKNTVSQLKTTKPLATKIQLKSSSSFKQAPPSSKKLKPKSRGLSGHGRTDGDRKFHSLVVNTGCFACNMIKRIPTSRLTIHHPKGRSKGKDDYISERWAMCLCMDHHDPSLMGASDARLPSVAAGKRLFVQEVGTEAWCVHETYRKLAIQPPWISESDWDMYLCLNEKEGQGLFLLALVKNLIKKDYLLACIK